MENTGLWYFGHDHFFLITDLFNLLKPTGCVDQQVQN